jgi:lysophospholipase L1-like esterase
MLPIEKIVLLGDSLTEFNSWLNLGEIGSVINQGIAGDTSMGVWCRVKGVASLNPTIIVLQVGINDLSQGIPPADVAQTHLRIWADLACQAPTGKLIVCTLMPIREENFGWSIPGFNNQTIRDTNALIKELAQEKNLVTLDLYPLVAEDDGELPKRMTYDGVHLTKLAYDIWESALKELLLNNQKQDSKP